jgi:SAM-dependent methyltransferase
MAENPEVPEAIYQRPEDYDLEHVGDTEDVDFFCALVKQLAPKRVLELACGNGRVTLPLAEAGAVKGFDVVGLELVPEMLAAARQKREEASPEIQQCLKFHEGDMRDWHNEPSAPPFDVIVTPCSSFCHLLTLDDQLAAFHCAYDNLASGGRFIVDVTMADLSRYVDSFRSPAREVVEIDLDTFDEETETRLIRYKTTRYLAHEQRARIRFLYDKFVGAEAQQGSSPERSVSDFESHVYYPREMHLLFRHTGFTVEKVQGDYRGRPLGPSSPQMIFTGIKPG